ncbi:hypothetical protein [Ectopseudomonas mendocina]|uniref:hypothetical protein n=1 Tax=Ectopseudomonas mendocina TaxID=300 RepID=UPI0011C0402D|nr:hypothetical protein [Pseudomonas mendocina]
MSSDFDVQYVWRYFELHSAQRMTLFNYYLIISGVIFTGLAATLQGSQAFSYLGVALGGLLVLFSFVFWKLDQRTSGLIKFSESILSVAEADTEVRFRIFVDGNIKSISGPVDVLSQWTYGRSFRFTYLIMSTIGIFCSVLSFCKAIGIISW